jgi:phosphoserine phosphatase RsbU/P
MPSLMLIKSPGGTASNQTFPLKFDGKIEIVIGRDKSKCDIFIDDGEQQVSRRQAFITQNNGQFYLNHAGRNPTLLNNKVLDNSEPQLLKGEDRIKVCDFLFRFHDERTAAPAPLPTSLLNALPDPNEADSEMTTVHHAVSNDSAKQFLEVQPVEQVRLLLSISTTLSRTLELDPLLEQIADSLFAVFRQADRCFVIQLDEAGRPYPKVIKARRANTGDRYSKTIIRRCIETNTSYLSEDASSDAALGAAQSIADFRIRSVMCVPLSTAEGVPLGAIQLDTQDVGKKFRDEDLKLLTIVANLASVAVEKAKFHAELIVREKAQREIELAKTVQLGFLPKGPPVLAGYEFFGFYAAAKTVGGDYYDYITLPGGKLAVVLGDVAGKGVPAAMLMAKLSAEARFAFLTEPNPAKAVTLLNKQLVSGGIGDRFVTLAACVIDPATHTVTTVNAGHQVPLLYVKHDRSCKVCVADTNVGLPLGVLDGYEYESDQLTLEPNQTLVVFTDGVTDAVNQAGTMFDLEGVENCLCKDDGIGLDPSPKSVGYRLAETVKRHANGAAPADDIAIVTFGRWDSKPAHSTSTRVPAIS